MSTSRRLLKRQMAAINTIEERMARIEAALGIGEDGPTPKPAPEAETGEQADSKNDVPTVKWDDLGSYTLAELKDIAETHEIDISGLRTKDPVVEAILAWVQTDAPADGENPDPTDDPDGDSMPNGDTSEDDVESEEHEE